MTELKTKTIKHQLGIPQYVLDQKLETGRTYGAIVYQTPRGAWTFGTGVYGPDILFNGRTKTHYVTTRWEVLRESNGEFPNYELALDGAKQYLSTLEKGPKDSTFLELPCKSEFPYLKK